MRVFISAFFFMSLATQFACTKHSDSTPDDSGLSYNDEATNAQLYAIEGVENASTAAETGVPRAAPNQRGHQVRRMLRLPQAKIATDCSTLTFGACANGATSVNVNGCTSTQDQGEVVFTGSGQISASFTNTGSSTPDNPACTAAVQTGSPLPSGDTLGLLFNLSIELTTFPDPRYEGLKLYSDFNPGQAWDGTTFPTASAGYVVTNSGASKSLVFNGFRDEVVAPHGTVFIDYLTSGNLTVSGTLAAGTRAIQDGSTLTSWHNVLKYKAVHTASGIAWTQSNCCHPTQGKLTSVFTGSLNRTTTFTFTGTCGVVNYDDGQGGAPTIVNLDPC